MISESEDIDCPPIFQLPTEILTKILEFVPSQKDVLSLRLVCRKWAKEIEDNCVFSAKLDDRQEPSIWTRICSLRLCSLEVVHLTSNPSTFLSSASFLKYPNLIRKLTLTPEITPENLYYILCDCSELVDLSIGVSQSALTNMQAQTEIPGSLTSLALTKIQSLHISCSTHHPNEFGSAGGMFGFLGSRVGPPPEDSPVARIFSQLLANPLPRLKSIKVELQLLGSREASLYTAFTLGGVGLHWRTLQSLDFELSSANHPIPCLESVSIFDSHIDLVDLDLLHKVQDLRIVRLVSSGSVGIDYFTSLLLEQGKLDMVEIDLIPIDISVYSRLVSSNFEMLTQVDLSDVSVWSSEDVKPFDLSIFQGCNSLRRLLLDRNVAKRRLFNDSAELINLFALPANLEELAFSYFNILSDELLYLVSDTERSLRSFSLTQCGDRGQFGVDGTVLETLIALPRIEFIEISQLNFSDTIEGIKLNMILVAFGYQVDHPYFQLKKLDSPDSIPSELEVEEIEENVFE